jgi:hypothetical protein
MKKTQLQEFAGHAATDAAAFVDQDENNGVLVVPFHIDREAETIETVTMFEGSTFDLFQALRASEDGRGILEDLTRNQLIIDSEMMKDEKGENE